MRFLIAILLFLFAAPAFAQETPDEDRSYLVNYVEEQLSTPNRQIRLSNIQGVLSSNATIGAITIADREGVWLRITNAQIIWTRLALLRGNWKLVSGEMVMMSGESVEVASIQEAVRRREIMGEVLQGDTGQAKQLRTPQASDRQA